jgi:hypothetical protein
MLSREGPQVARTAINGVGSEERLSPPDGGHRADWRYHQRSRCTAAACRQEKGRRPCSVEAGSATSRQGRRRGEPAGAQAARHGTYKTTAVDGKNGDRSGQRGGRAAVGGTRVRGRVGGRPTNSHTGFTDITQPRLHISIETASHQLAQRTRRYLFEVDRGRAARVTSSRRFRSQRITPTPVIGGGMTCGTRSRRRW